MGIGGVVGAGTGKAAAATGGAGASGTKSSSGADRSWASAAPISAVGSSKAAGCCTMGSLGSGPKVRSPASGCGVGRSPAGRAGRAGCVAAAGRAAGSGAASGGGASAGLAPAYGAAGACHCRGSPWAGAGGHWLRTGATAGRRGVAAGGSRTVWDWALRTAVRSLRPTMRDCGPNLVGVPGRVGAGRRMMPSSGSSSSWGTLAAGTEPAVFFAWRPAGWGAAVAGVGAGGKCGYTASTGCCAANWYTNVRVAGRAAPPSTVTLGSASSQASSRTENSGEVGGRGGTGITGAGHRARRANPFPNATPAGPHLGKKHFRPVRKKVTCVLNPCATGLAGLFMPGLAAAFAFCSELIYGYHD